MFSWVGTKKKVQEVSRGSEKGCGVRKRHMSLFTTPVIQTSMLIGLEGLQHLAWRQKLDFWQFLSPLTFSVS